MKSNVGLAMKIYVWIFIYCCFEHGLIFALLSFVLGTVLACVPLWTSKLLMIPSMIIVAYSFFWGDRAFSEWVLIFMPFIYIAAADTALKMFD